MSYSLVLPPPVRTALPSISSTRATDSSSAASKRYPKAGAAMRTCAPSICSRRGVKSSRSSRPKTGMRMRAKKR